MAGAPNLPGFGAPTSAAVHAVGELGGSSYPNLPTCVGGADFCDGVLQRRLHPGGLRRLQIPRRRRDAPSRGTAEDPHQHADEPSAGRPRELVGADLVLDDGRAVLTAD
jgi:hypothetical protein